MFPVRSSLWSSGDAAFVAVLALAVVLRVVFFTGYHGYDDVYYIERAFALSEGDRSLPIGAWQGRLGLVGPTALAYWAFGVTRITTNLFPFLCSLAGIVVAYVLGTRLFGQRSALLAALMLALFPLDVLFAGQLFPTAPVILFAGGALGLFVLAERTGCLRSYLASGACFGLALTAHEGAVMCLAFYPVYLVLGAASWKQAWKHAWLGVGLLLGFGLDPLLHTVLFGEPLARLMAIRGSHATMLNSAAGDVAYAGFNLAWIGEGVVRPFVERTFGLFPCVLVVAWWMGVRASRGSAERALSIIVGVGVFWIYFGSISLTHYSPMSRMPRYLAPVMLPGAWLLGRFLDQRSARQRLGLIAALALTSLACLALDSGNALPPYDQARDVLARLKPRHVLAEQPFPLRFAEGMRPSYRLEVLGETSPEPGTVVVVRGRRAQEGVAALPGAQRVADLIAPETLYLRVLRNEVVMAILRATRPADRFAEYANKLRPAAVVIYRID